MTLPRNDYEGWITSSEQGQHLVEYWREENRFRINQIRNSAPAGAPAPRRPGGREKGTRFL